MEAFSGGSPASSTLRSRAHGQAAGETRLEDKRRGKPPPCAVSAVGLEPIQRSGRSIVPLGASTKRRAHRSEREPPVCWCWLRNALPITGTAGAHVKLTPGLDPSKPHIVFLCTTAPSAPFDSSVFDPPRTLDPTHSPHILICPCRDPPTSPCLASGTQHGKNIEMRFGTARLNCSRLPFLRRFAARLGGLHNHSDSTFINPLESRIFFCFHRILCGKSEQSQVQSLRPPFGYSTVTLLARFRGWSTSVPRRSAI